MHPVIQEETTGCGIAACAAIAGISYQQAKATANHLGIYAQDPSLWSQTQPVQKLLQQLGFNVANATTPFTDWQNLPDLALLAIKWHQNKGAPHWHWAVFVRHEASSYVLDSKPSLARHMRTDFGRIKPKWFLAVHRETA